MTNLGLTLHFPWQRSLVKTQARAFGAGPKVDPNHQYVYYRNDSRNQTVKEPAPGDREYHLPQKGILNEKIHMWLAGRLNVEKDDILNNTRANKYSAYYHFGSNPL